ncbi:MAG: hypothetical protein K1X83_06660 [Oligoflexia bacterium]|nr:hypothetical protein [Oligoflexia bacterium]
MSIGPTAVPGSPLAVTSETNPGMLSDDAIEAELPRTPESNLEAAVARALSSGLFEKEDQLQFPAGDQAGFQHVFTRAETEHFVSLTYELLAPGGERVAAIVRNTYPEGAGMYIAQEPAGPICSDFEIDRELAQSAASIWANPEQALKSVPPEFADLASVALEQIRTAMGTAAQ